MSITLSPAIPVLRIFDEAKAKEFYVDFLGFTLGWEHRFGDNFPLYASVNRAGLELHLSEHYGDATPGSTVFIPMQGVDALQAELLAKNYPYAKPGVEDLEWGRQMQISDPFGNKLRFCQLSD
ncbi:glyoxalase superfamily protein [Chitinimonas sp.]|uniref:glyoxalase superfamily protein n=1 Tax=Chitinimonas sp. TaxID=1934313 RepID=UPI002F95FE7F